MALTTKILYANNATSTLASGIDEVATSLSVQGGHGARFPNPAAGECFIITARDAAGNVERMIATSRSTDTFSGITRSVDGTTARSWAAGDKVEIRLGSLELSQFVSQVGSNVFAVGGGTGNALTGSYSPTFAALVNGMEVRLRASAANTGAATFAPDGLSAKSIVKENNTALVANDIVANQEVTLRYNAALDKWVLLNPAVTSRTVTTDTTQTITGAKTFSGAVIYTSSTALALSSNSPGIDFRETDQALPAGKWRLIADGGSIRIEQNTAVAGDYATNIYPIFIGPLGGVRIGKAPTGGDLGDGYLNAAGGIRVNNDPVATLAAANTFTANNTFLTTGVGTPLISQSTDSTANYFTGLLLDRASTTAAANDGLSRIVYRGRDSLGNVNEYADIRGLIVDTTDGSENGALLFGTMRGGALAMRLRIDNGVTVLNAGALPTGGEKGPGTFNSASTIYQNNDPVATLGAANAFTAAQTITVSAGAAALTVTRGSGADDIVLKPGFTTSTLVPGTSTSGVITTNGNGSTFSHLGFWLPANDTGDSFFVATDSDLNGTPDFLAFQIRAVGDAKFGRSIQIGAPTGGDKGSGTINCASTIYQNNDPVATLAGTNAFTGTNTVTTTVAGVSPLKVVSTGAGVSAGPLFDIDRNSDSPAASDFLGQYRFTGRDSGGNYTAYALIGASIIDPTDTSEDGRIFFQINNGGSLSSPVLDLRTGVQIGSPTGGDKGANTLNVASTIYQNNVAVVTETGIQTLTSKTLNSAVVTGKSSSLKPLVKDHGTKGGNFTLQMDEAELHIIAFSAAATLTCASTNTNDKAAVVVKNGGNAITLAGIDNDAPTLTNGASKQDFIGLIKSFGTITAVSFVADVATA